MKTKHRILPAVLASLALSCAARATLIVEESYQNYTAGTVADDTIAGNATGLTTENLRLNGGGAGVTTEIVNGTPMTYTGGSISVSGGSQYLKFSSSVADMPVTTLGGTLADSLTPSNGTLYMSFLYQFNGDMGNDDRAFLSLQTDATGTVYAPGLGFGTQSTSATVSLNGVRKYGSTLSNDDQTFFMVAKITSDGTNWTGIEMWVNPTSAALGAPDAALGAPDAALAAPDAAFWTTMNAISPFASLLDAGQSFQIDRLQIGTTVADVIPEP